MLIISIHTVCGVYTHRYIYKERESKERVICDVFT